MKWMLLEFIIGVGDKEPNPEIIDTLELIPNSSSYPRFPVMVWVFSFSRREVKKLNVKIEKKNPGYNEFSKDTFNNLCCTWPSLRSINYRIRDALDVAEKNKILIHEIKKS